MTGELDSEPRPTCWDRWAGWSWKVVSPCRLTGLVLTLMTSERFVWIQMSSDGFVWICMGSDEFRYIQIQIWMEEMDRDGFRQIEMESDRLRWIQMVSNGLRLTQVRWPPWAAVQGWWVQELTLRNNPGFRISPSGCSSSISIAWEHGLYKYFPSRENILFGRVYEPGRYEETIRVCGLEPDLQVQRILNFFWFS